MNTTFSDRGTYKCTFNNTVGNASATVRLNVQGYNNYECVIVSGCGLIVIFIIF